MLHAEGREASNGSALDSIDSTFQHDFSPNLDLIITHTGLQRGLKMNASMDSLRRSIERSAPGASIDAALHQPTHREILRS